MTGRLYGIGVGPGDPELITLKAKKILERVPVICYPRSSADRESVALRIVADLVMGSQGDRERLELVFPMTRDRVVLEKAWSEAAAQVAGRLKDGRDVAFITLGDASVYSTFSYLASRVAALAPEAGLEVIPGVPSFVAGAAAAGIPLALGGESLAVIPAIDDLDQVARALEDYDNIVLMKVNRRFESLLRLLDRLKLKDKTVALSRIGSGDQKICTDLEELSGTQVDYLTVLLVRKGERP